ncbi:MAG: TIGR03013 family PEP-CTERM/XrtA system glycosyltransferase [Azoarcus sp.]|jgi:sugar transferase (PEP-CTERM system associated)|nr:TIGR03013 family PEP-CTERM/XrtA system glycosyltransferase [Azoarcus sp.]
MLKIFSHYFPLHVVRRLCLDLFLFTMIVVVAALFQPHSDETAREGLFTSALCFAMTMVIASFAFGLYRPVDEDSPRIAFARFVLVLLFCLPVAYGLVLFLPWSGFSSLAIQAQVLVLTLVVLVLRMFINRSQASSLFAPRILVIGIGEDALEVARTLLRPEQGRVAVQGFFAPESEEEMLVDAQKVISGSSLVSVVRQLNIDEIIVAVRERRGGALPVRELLDCKLLGVRIFDLSSFHERVRRQVRLDSLRMSWLVYGEGFRQPLRQVFVKRVFDLAASIVLLIVSLPLLIVIALLIVAEDRGPVFYRQERVGLSGQVFRVIKFRSMRPDAEKKGEPLLTASDDGRITRIGRIIRRLRIDELPQLLNVFMGDMSLVGPRPERPYLVDRMAREIPFYGMRHCVKPGITGWAQVRHLDISPADDAIQRLQYDLYYVKNHTLVLDMLVLLETVHVVLMGKGAR